MNNGQLALPDDDDVDSASYPTPDVGPDHRIDELSEVLGSHSRRIHTIEKLFIDSEKVKDRQIELMSNSVSHSKEFFKWGFGIALTLVGITIGLIYFMYRATDGNIKERFERQDKILEQILDKSKGN